MRLRAAGGAEAQIVNEMAVQTAMLSQDRCTKNYYIYLDPATALCAHPSVHLSEGKSRRRKSGEKSSSCCQTTVLSPVAITAPADVGQRSSYCSRASICCTPADIRCVVSTRSPSFAPGIAPVRLRVTSLLGANMKLHRTAPSGWRCRWQRLPYDLKGAFATDRGFNGKPAADYCVLNCAQWNSPLYCSGPRYAQVLAMHLSTCYLFS